MLKTANLSMLEHIFRSLSTKEIYVPIFAEGGCFGEKCEWELL